jgi:hypothetical protein
MAQSGAEGERRSCHHNNRAIRKRQDWRGYQMYALPSVLEALAMQDHVDGSGGGWRRALGGRPSRAKQFRRFTPAKKARAVTRRKGHGLVEEEKLGPAPASHDRASSSLVLATAHQLCLCRPPSGQQVFVAGSWMMPRLPVNMPRCEMATISPKGVTRF